MSALDSAAAAPAGVASRIPAASFGGEARPRLSFRTQMILLIGSLVAVMLLAQGAYLNHRYARILEDQIGLRALNVAKTVATIPELIAAFDEADPSRIIQPIAERVRREIGAAFVVVGNRDSIRYSHPVPDRIGQHMVGDDNAPALEEGEAYVSRATGTLGPSIRGKVPVFSARGEIVGVVSVGFLTDEIDDRVADYLAGSRLPVALTILAGLIGAIALSRRFKRAILGLEPYEIARRLREKEAILDSIHEGIVAVNPQGRITLLNHAARRFFSPGDLVEDPVGAPLQSLLPNSRLQEVLASGESQFDQETWVGHHLVVVNRVPIVHDGRVVGAVATFRNRTEILDLSRRLLEISRHADALRAQAHDYSNKLHTIAGLLQLGRTREALDLISQETRVEQARVSQLMRRVADPVLCGILLGQMARAADRGVAVDLDDTAGLVTLLNEPVREALVSIVGNLLENACEAALTGAAPPRVRLFFTDLGEDLLFEIDDSGPGVPDRLAESIFGQGFSTKAETGRGIGLARVRRLCRSLGGDVSLEDSELGGACFIATVAKAKAAAVAAVAVAAETEAAGHG